MRRARILSQVDANGPNWPARAFPEAFRCRVRTVETMHNCCVPEGFPLALEGRKRQAPLVPKLFHGEQ